MKCFLSLFLVVAIIFLITSCTTPTGEVIKEDEVIKIGVVLPLTGTAANYGIDTKKGIDLALEEINKVGVYGKRIDLIYEDDKCKAKEALSQIHEQTEAFSQLRSISPEAFEHAQMQAMASYLEDIRAVLQRSE